MNAISNDLEKVAQACRLGLIGLLDAKGSTFYEFPSGACGDASEIFGRVVWETFQYEGEYVCGSDHPTLEDGMTHAWFEVGDFIIDITYDQFPDTGLRGWVFDRNNGWHAQFCTQERRQGFYMPSGWSGYPSAGYKAARQEAEKVGLICRPD
jgi:hypothetical protein